LQPELEIEQIAPELIGTGAQAVVENAKRLGLTWTIRLATVVDATIDAVTAIYDGDTVAIGMTSMIGSVFVGQRVYVIQVPPSGNFIVGFVGMGSVNTYAIANQIGTLGSAGAEAAFASASWAREPSITIGPGRITRVIAELSLFIGSATNSILTLRIRKGSPPSIAGTQLLYWQPDLNTAAFTTATTKAFVGYIKNTTGSVVTSPLVLTIAAGVGAASVSGYSDGNLPFNITFEDFADVTDDPIFTAGLVTV